MKGFILTLIILFSIDLGLKIYGLDKAETNRDLVVAIVAILLEFSIIIWGGLLSAYA